MSKGFASNYRIALLAGGMFLCFVAVGVRLVWLHVIDRPALLDTIARARRGMTIEKAKRGDILDRNGVVLATSRPLILVAVDPWAVGKNDEAKLPQLAALLEMPESEVRRAFAQKYAPLASPRPSATPESLSFGFRADGPAESDEFPDETGQRKRHWNKLSDHVTEATYAEIEKLDIKALCQPERRYTRVYPNNHLASHLIGYVNREESPVTGIEAYSDFYLRGQNGWRVGEVDGRRRELAQFNIREVPHTNGYNVRLSIDWTVQDVIEQELSLIAKKYQPLKASIVVSDPRTGFILGMANYPSFNLNAYNEVPKEEMGRMKNVAVTDIYEPGSVFKIVAASGALEQGLVTPESKFDCSLEKIDYKGRTRKLPREDHAFENLTVAEIIAHSSNRGAAQLAMKLGDETFYNYARAFGFGARLGFPVGGEVGGILHGWKATDWDITRVPMGQSVSCTVLQMHQAMSVIASGGVLLRPQIVREIRDSSNELVYRYGREESGRAISERTAQTMARLLMAVASKEGTAPEAAIPGYKVAGKTGTAQKYVDGRPSERNHVVSFVGFFPADRPQVAISVIIDDADAHAPGGVAYGSKVAAPSFKAIGEKLIPILDIKSDSVAARLPALAANEGGRR